MLTGTLADANLDKIVTVARPERFIGDRAYDSDPLDQRLAARGIELIAPHMSNRKGTITQDRRALRRWKVERLFAWLNAFKRVTRWSVALIIAAASLILLSPSTS